MPKSKSIKYRAIDEHLNLIHKARVRMVSTLLPPGEVILDLGGANCPIYKMGYPHKFKKLYLVDLPLEKRHEVYKDLVIDDSHDSGEIIVRYGDMTELDDYADESVDFVWSGQSIEHVSEKDGKKMCNAAFRVLKKGGAFCLDTPNRLLTKIHVRKAGIKYIHPEHHIEYYPKDLKNIIINAGFIVSREFGICEMPATIKKGEFCYEDFLLGNQIVNEVERGYIQFYHCVKN